MKILYTGIAVFSLLLVVSLVMLNGGQHGEISETHKVTGKVTGNAVDKSFSTFTKTDNVLCLEDGKPVIRLYSTTWCPHCRWIKETFDKVVKEYADKGQIVAHHWELDAKDDTLTEENEGNIPDSEMQIFRKFDPSGGVPAFVFGCKYYRLGNGYERAENGLELEEQEIRNAIDSIIAEANAG